MSLSRGCRGGAWSLSGARTGSVPVLGRPEENASSCRSVVRYYLLLGTGLAVPLGQVIWIQHQVASGGERAVGGKFSRELEVQDQLHIACFQQSSFDRDFAAAISHRPQATTAVRIPAKVTNQMLPLVRDVLGQFRQKVERIEDLEVARHTAKQVTTGRRRSASAFDGNSGRNIVGGRRRPQRFRDGSRGSGRGRSRPPDRRIERTAAVEGERLALFEVGKRFQKSVEVAPLLEHLLPMIAPIDHMIDQPFLHRSQRAVTMGEACADVNDSFSASQ